MGQRGVSEWPPPGYWRDPDTGKQWRATEREEREANRLLAKHRDIAKSDGAGRPPIPPAAIRFLAGLGVDVSALSQEPPE
jgi:hypothetical protein